MLRMANHTKYTLNTKRTKYTKNTKYAQNARHIKSSQNAKQTKYTQNTKHTNYTEHTKRTKHLVQQINLYCWRFHLLCLLQQVSSSEINKTVASEDIAGIIVAPVNAINGVLWQSKMMGLKYRVGGGERRSPAGARAKCMSS